MKHSILGFSQEKALEYGLTLTDLLLLRWFIDYMDTPPCDNLIARTYGGINYYYVDYQNIADEFPITGLTSGEVFRRFRKMSNKGILNSGVMSDKTSRRNYTIADTGLNLCVDMKE